MASELTKAYGSGWGKRHLWHCVRVADTFPEDQIMNALSTQLSWTHLRILAAIEDELKRVFYTELSMQEQWSTRVLQERMIACCSNVLRCPGSLRNSSERNSAPCSQLEL